MAALSEELDLSVLGPVAARWLGGSGAWHPPGQTEAASARLRRRLKEEDASALEHLGQVWMSAACQLASDPQSYDADLTLGFRAGADACEALGRVDAAVKAGANSGEPAPEYNPTEEASSVAVSVIEVQREGMSLRYAFLRPADLTARVDALRAVETAPVTAAQTVTDRFLDDVGTARWGAGEGSLPQTKAILASLPSDSARLAALDEAVTEGVNAWRTLLSAAGANVPELDPSTRKTLEGWATRALRRDLGLALLEQGEPQLAMAVLEEAAGSQVRVRPGPGLDPLLLAALARARYESNQPRRAVDLLEDIGKTQGWELAHEAARAVAREVAMPSTVEAKVKR